MGESYIQALDNVKKTDILRAGGKAANLGEMLHAGLNVPGGFVILTNAYKRFVQVNKLEEKIEHLLDSADLKSSALEKISDQIRDLFTGSQIPGDLQEEIIEAYRGLGNGTDVSVAVRSSATAEDMPGLSFAGQYSTYLNVKGEKELIESVAKCWASLWNSRAISYRLRQKIGNVDILHGVVVQKLINADVAGVLFTANPLNGRRDQILLNASWGLGEAVVGGDVDPDEWVVAKSTGEIVREKVARKQKMYVRDKKGVHLVGVKEEMKNVSSLFENQRSALLDLAIKTERYFGEPQDIEWASIKEEIYLVQTRPVTSLYPLPKRHPNKPGVRLYLNISSYSQAMKEPFTPMGEDLIYRAIRNTRKDLGPKKITPDSLWYLSTAGGRLFVDITAFLRKEKFWEKFRKPDATDKDPVTTRALLRYVEENREEILGHKEGVSYLKILNPRLIRYLWRGWRELSFGKKHPQEARRRAVASGEKYIERLKTDTVQLENNEQKITFIKDEIHSVFLAGARTLFYVTSSSSAIAKVKEMMERRLGDSNGLGLVEKAVPYSVTTEMGMELMTLAKNYREKGNTPSPDDEPIKNFLSVYGHKKFVELDVGTPTWSEEPGYVLNLISSYMENRHYEKALKEFRQSQYEAQETIQKIKRRFEENGFGKEAEKSEWLLKSFREMFGIREQSKFVITQGLQLIRTLLFDIGNELVREGRLEKSDDIFFVKLDDITLQNDLKGIVKRNRETFEKNANLKAPRLITSLGETTYAAAEPLGDGTISGIAVSSGVYEGYARVLVNPEEGDTLQNGEILVTNGTNPAWTPLFLKIGALVMECGGPISHGSVVAREYGIPAVSGITDATEIIKTGQKLRVNGESGTIRIVEEGD
ncbi:Phosphoenolpyruvate synthase [Chitinispirillum alkaliphilum]|nr:Phosphoenolpyruvate synthase [Chitinispirillum alkaliphilum]